MVCNCNNPLLENSLVLSSAVCTYKHWLYHFLWSALDLVCTMCTLIIHVSAHYEYLMER